MTLITALGASFTRPNDTTAYASGDLVANSVTAGSVTPMTFNGWTAGQAQTIMLRIRIVKTGTTPTNASFRVHFYESSPVCANGDNGAWSTDKAAGYLGNIDMAAMFAFTDGCSGFGSAAAGSEMRLRLSSGGTIYALMEARAAYTPAANEVFTVKLECLDSY
jgi:hypothetical protein